MDKNRKYSPAQRGSGASGESRGRSAQRGAYAGSQRTYGYGSRAVSGSDNRRQTRYGQYTDARRGYYSGYDTGREPPDSKNSSGYSERSRTERTQRGKTAGTYASERYGSAAGNIAEKRAAQQRRLTDADRRRELERERKRRRLRRKRIKAAALAGLFLLAAVILIFMTPIFNIKQITLEGNNAVTKEQIQEKVGDLIGKNLFATTANKIESRVMEIPQVSSADASKKLFPPSIKLSITECSPAAYLLSGNKIIVIDSDLKIIDDSNSFDTDVIPSISGISIPSYTLNQRLSSDSAEKEEILSSMLKSFESTGLLSSVSYISLDDLSNIKFNYNNRLEADCGSQLELERKIRMFAAAISSDELSASTTGTIDLSVPGTAVLDR